MNNNFEEEKIVNLNEAGEAERKEGQENIYYASGESVSKIDSLPQVEQIKKLKDLLDQGILTEEEFQAKKKQILKI